MSRSHARGLCAATPALAAAAAHIGGAAARPAASPSVVLKATLTGPYLHTTATGKHSVFPFTATTSTAPGCEALGRWGGPVGEAWAKKVVANPGHFYVIIGTNRYPNGAIGGVLHR
jgi:hypothetical protein